jgi:membrane fusion protein (multidrug efflux system)
MGGRQQSQKIRKVETKDMFDTSAPQKLSARKKVYGFLVLVLILAVGGYFINQRFNSSGTSEANAKSGSGEKKSDGETIVPVELATAAKGDISAYLTATANLRALREVDVASQGQGIVKQVLAEEGDFVKEGQVLCALDDTDLQIRSQSIQQRLAQAKLQLEKGRIRQEKTQVQIRNAREDHGRLEKLFVDRLVSEREVAQARYRIEELEHEERIASSEGRELTHRVRELESELDQVQLEISQSQTKAPFSGHVIQRMINLGQLVRRLDPVFKLGAFSPLYADVFLSEREASTVHQGQRVSLKLGANESIQAHGKIARLSPVVDQATGTVKITVELSQVGGQFKPGAFVRVEIQTDTRANTILIPKQAVLEEDNEKYVFIANGETAKRIKVKLGYESNGKVEILNGIASGQQVVVAGQGGLKDGTKIKVVQSRNHSEPNLQAALR